MLEGARQPRDREPGDREADEREHGSLGERGQVLGLAVAERMRTVGGTAGDADREEGEDGSDEVGARVERLGDEPEAAADQPGDELERKEQRRGGDRGERGSPQRAHGRRLDGFGRGDDQRLPRRACSRSIDSKSALKLPSPNVVAPWRSITSKKSVGRSCAVFVKIWSR